MILFNGLLDNNLFFNNNPPFILLDIGKLYFSATLLNNNFFKFVSP